MNYARQKRLDTAVVTVKVQFAPNLSVGKPGEGILGGCFEDSFEVESKSAPPDGRIFQFRFVGRDRIVYRGAAKMEKHDKNEKGGILLLFRLYEHDPKKWEKFREFMDSRQLKIEEWLDQIKG